MTKGSISVKLVLDLERPVKTVAGELGIHENTLYKWIGQHKKHQEHAFPGSGKQLPEDAEIKRLKEGSRPGRGKRNPKKGRGHLRQTPEIAYKFIYQHRFDFRVQKMW